MKKPRIVSDSRHIKSCINHGIYGCYSLNYYVSFFGFLFFSRPLSSMTLFAVQGAPALTVCRAWLGCAKCTCTQATVKKRKDNRHCHWEDVSERERRRGGIAQCRYHQGINCDLDSSLYIQSGVSLHFRGSCLPLTALTLGTRSHHYAPTLRCALSPSHTETRASFRQCTHLT